MDRKIVRILEIDAFSVMFTAICYNSTITNQEQMFGDNWEFF